MKKSKKGAALIMVLFMLIIVSVFISLIFLTAKNDISLNSSIQKESQYNQYLKEALDITISPLLMGDGNRIIQPPIKSITDPRDEFIIHFRSQPNINIPPSNINPMIAIDNTDDPQNNLLLIINIARRLEPNSPLWAVSQVQIDADYARRIPVEPVPRYKLNITSVIGRFNNVQANIGNFSNLVTNNINNIVWQGRAKAEIIQRTPFNLAQNSALFVKYAGLWVPFGANPFKQTLLNQGIDSCVGITDGYNILGDLSTPQAAQNESFVTAFDGQFNNNKSGITTIWQGTQSNALIRGNATTGYASIDPNNLRIFQNDNNEYSIRTNRFSQVGNNGTSNSNIQGRIPGESDNQAQVIDLQSVPNGVRITINSNTAVVVGQTVDQNGNLGQIRTRPQGGGLVEVLWPLDNNGNPVRIDPNNPNDPNRQILNSYPPGYANVYVVPEGNQLRIFAVGKYSGQKVPYDELISAIPTIQNSEIPHQRNGNDIVINLNQLDDTQRAQLSTISVEGGNVILMPPQNGNPTLFYNLNNNQNQQIPFDLTIIATRLNNNDNLDDPNLQRRNFYTRYQNQNGIDPSIGGWIFTQQPSNFTIDLGNNGARYVIPKTDNQFDRRRQVVRALEGNVIIQDFNDQNFNGIRDNGERSGYIGFVPDQQNRLQKQGGHLTILSHNFVILNYQTRQNQRQTTQAGLDADIISYRGSLQIIDEDSYRFLLDHGRFRRTEVNQLFNNITTNDTLYWNGKYIGNFANIEGVAIDDNTIRGFSNVTINGTGINNNLPRTTRQDYRVLINGRPIILYDILQFVINK